MTKDDSKLSQPFWIDGRFYITIRRNAPELVISVYPITDGQVWDHPCDTFIVDEDTILQQEAEMKE